MQLDKTDIKIMRELYRDFIMPPRNAQVRRSFRSIAKSVKIDQHAIRSRIRRLQEEGVIRRWYIAINPTLFGLKTASVVISCRPGYDKELILQKIYSSIPNVAFMCNYLGEKLIVVLYYKNAEDLDKNINEIKRIASPTYLTWAPRPFPQCKAAVTKTDWMIIKSLQQDPWKPYTAISKGLKISAKTVKRRVTTLANEGAIYLLVNVNMKSFEGIIPTDLIICYDDNVGDVQASRDKTRTELVEYLGDQVVFFEPNCGPDMDHFALVLTNISTSQEIQKWANERQGIREAQMSILMDLIPPYKVYEEQVENMIKRQKQVPASYVKAEI
jgi:DNA-binding Lrp family transcriptional regulator